jgi:hypothetical protein
MNSGYRALTAVGVIAVGWTLMTIAYDKPEWFYQVAGIVGLVFVIGAAIWWPLSARRARSMSHRPSGGKANGG